MHGSGSTRRYPVARAVGPRVARPVAASRGRIDGFSRRAGFIPIDFGELWRYRELLYRFLWRDFKARYKQTYLGPFWAIFRPLVSIVLFSVIFGSSPDLARGAKASRIRSSLSGCCPGRTSARRSAAAASSILNSTGLFQKVYFPRIYAPLSAGVTPLVDLALTMVIAVSLFVYYSVFRAGTSSSCRSSSCSRSSSRLGSVCGSRVSWCGIATPDLRCRS